MWNPPSPREGWRSRMVGRTSAQLAQKALSLSLVALRMPKPPLDKEMLALSLICCVPAMSQRQHRQFHTALSWVVAKP